MPRDSSKTNAQGQELLNILKGLGAITGKITDSGINVLGAIDRAPREILSNLIANASNLTAQQDLQKSTQGTKQRLEGMGLENTDPLKDATLKEVIKVRKQQVQEAAQAGVPLDHILEQSGVQNQDNQLNNALAGGQQENNVVQEVRPEVLTDIQRQAQSLVEPATGPLGKLFEAMGFGTRTKAQQLSNLSAAQQILGQQPLQEGERELQGLQTQRQILKDLYSGKITDQQELQQSALTFQNDLTNLVDAWEGLGSGRGALGGTIGAISAATLGRLFGTGREARSRFEAMSNGVLYSVGDYVLGQSGRALTEKDLERLEKLAKFTPRMKREDFRGRLQAVLDFANSKIKAAGGEPTIKSSDQLINHVRGIRDTTPTIKRNEVQVSTGNNFIIEQVGE